MSTNNGHEQHTSVVCRQLYVLTPMRKHKNKQAHKHTLRLRLPGLFPSSGVAEWFMILNILIPLCPVQLHPPPLTPTLSVSHLHDSFHLVFCLPLHSDTQKKHTNTHRHKKHTPKHFFTILWLATRTTPSSTLQITHDYVAWRQYWCKAIDKSHTVREGVSSSLDLPSCLTSGQKAVDMH